ncbi:MAG: SPOR domain-containing protein [Erythrobacter sp.]
MESNFNSRSAANRAGRASSMMALVIPAALAGIAFASSTSAAAAPAAEDPQVAKAEAALKSGQAEKAVVHAEMAVAADPFNADTRALLGAAYLGAGRFMAAASAFEDALDLGQEDARTVLSYALAKTAIGDGRVAVAALDDARARLNAADYGLALALAGQPERGVKVLVDAVRFEEATPKLRQNLAYAYALSGNWRAARVMAAEDLPAGQVDARMVEWAATAGPDQTMQRVASLLKVTPAHDIGQPAHLALANFEAAPAPAAAAPVPMVAAMAAPAPAPARVAAPAVVAAATADEAPAAIAEADASNTPVQVERVDPTPARFAQAFAASEVVVQPVAAPEPQPGADTGAIRFVSSPVVQELPAAPSRPVRAAAPVAAPLPAPAPQRRMAATAEASAPAAAVREVANDKNLASHLVQLGSYTSRIEAERGWNALKAKFPQLKDHDVVITEAVVNGRTFFRVAAAGFGPKSAASLCSTIKSAGRGCFAYLASNPPAGAVDKGVRLAARSR